MRVKGATVQKFLLGTALLSALAWNLAHASEIKGLDIREGATGTRAEIALDGAGSYSVMSLKGPDRLVVDLPASSLAKGAKLPAGAGIIKSVRTGQPTAGTVRIVFDLAESVAVLKPRIENGEAGPRLVLEWPGDGSATARLTPAVAATSGSQPVSTPTVTPTEQAPAQADPVAASSAATSRLISQIAGGTVATSAGQSNGGAVATSSVANANPPPAANAGTTQVTAAQTTAKGSATPGAAMNSTSAPARPGTESRIATGVPTRIATGKPAAVATPSTETISRPPVEAAGDVTASPIKTLQGVMNGRGARPLVIAIDPGHGGQDPGALGLNGSREKDVTLAISKELARQLNSTPGLKAHLTRDRDMFIPLPQRAKLARAARADMFISIHADAAENRSADGSSVYVLSLKGASSQRARWLANKENTSDMIGGVRLEKANNTLASVLLDLTQSGHMRASEEAAGHILGGLKRVGNVHKPHVERANFAVLRTSDMPAMLVETAFISNPEEERRLNDPAYVRQLAGAVVDGVTTYFTRQPPPGTLFAARAAAQSQPKGAAGGSP